MLPLTKENEKEPRFWVHRIKDGRGQGRLYFHFGYNKSIRFSWNLWSNFFHATVDVGGEENDLTVALAVPPLAFWIGFEGFLPYKALPRMWGRSTGVRVFDYKIWLDVWRDDSGWTTHKHKSRIVIDPIKFLLGRDKYTARDISKHEVIIPMPEGEYPATVRLFESTWKRPRWFAKKMIRAEVECEQGVPIPGKWDPEDAIFSLTTPAKTVDEAVQAMVRSAMDDRVRRASAAWRPKGIVPTESA